MKIGIMKIRKYKNWNYKNWKCRNQNYKNWNLRINGGIKIEAIKIQDSEIKIQNKKVVENMNYIQN